MGNLGLLPYVFLWVEVLILLYHLNLVKIVLLTHQILYLVVLQVCQNLAQIVPQIPCPGPPPFSAELLQRGTIHTWQATLSWDGHTQDNPQTLDVLED